MAVNFTGPAMAKRGAKGRCDSCGNNPRVLAQIESGQRLCRTCLHELRPPRAKHLATTKQIARLRERGFRVAQDATKDEVKRLDRIDLARGLGFAVRDDALEAEVFKLLGTYRKFFHTKVGGVTYKNDDGSDRQKIIRRCRVGETVLLVREPNNQYNRRAVKVVRRTGEQLGYLADEIVGNDQGIGWCVANRMDRGEEFEVVISDITGDGGEYFGVNLEVTYCPYRT